jgi:uncharacterized Ntn-hydrolase superfamily protein
MSNYVSKVSGMTKNSAIKCLEHARAAGLSLDKQNAMAVQVLQRMHLEWSNSQIDDTVDARSWPDGTHRKICEIGTLISKTWDPIN